VPAVACVLAVASVLAGCAGAALPSGQAGDLSRPGPNAVGATTLDLGSAGTLGKRLATVFYPADRAAAAGHPRFSYKLGDPLPPSLVALVPAKYDSTITTTALLDAPGSQRGPFPVVLFSHGFGASRLYYSDLLTGIASWGYVVVSADYLERGLVAEATSSTVPDSPAVDVNTMLASLGAAERAAGDPSSPLYRTVDAGRVAAVGHSSGGQTAFDALRDPRVKVAVGWAPEGPDGTPAAKPSTIIGATGDIALTPGVLTRQLRASRGPTTLVEISGEGHNTFTDLCPTIRGGGGGLVGYAISLHVISGALARLAVNGCSAKDLPAGRFWPIVQAYTLEALGSGLGIRASGLPEAGVPSAFPGFTVRVQHRG
jgi:dienelactone hydrolase